MIERHVALLVVAAAMARQDHGQHVGDDGLVARFARRATGAMADVVEPDAFLDKVDVNALLDRVDPDALLDRVDVNRLLDRVDVNELMDRVDVNRLLDRVDIDAFMDRVDVEDLVVRAGIPDIVRDSTGALAGSALDVFRRQLVALDTIVGRTAYRLRGRDPDARPDAPEALETVDDGTGVDEGGRGQITGHYAGPVTRALAFAADVAIVWIGFLLIGFGLAFVVELFSSVDVRSGVQSIVALLVLVTWSFTYHVVSYAVAGKTAGMSVLGLRVLNREGNGLTGRQALVRTVTLPMSVAFFGLGCLGILFGAERRGFHDAAAGSIVVYDWGDRPAEMPAPITAWIADKAAD